VAALQVLKVLQQRLVNLLMQVLMLRQECRDRALTQ
jgi:hypothetical protein